MPHQYPVNEPIERRPIFEGGNAVPKLELLEHGVLRLAEAAECIGGIQGHHDQRMVALKAALLVAEIYKRHPRLFKHHPRWSHNRFVSGLIGQKVNRGLKKAL